MGIYSRDYVRESNSRAGGFSGDTPACKWLIMITVVVYLLQFLSTFPLELDDGRVTEVSFVDQWFSLSPDGIRSGKIWQFISYAFLHDRGSLLHLIFNMLGLWWFGAEIERLYGSKEFTWFYLSSAAVAGAGFIVWELAMKAHAPVMGASGAVMAVLTVFAMHYPRHTVYFQGIIPLEIRWLLAIYIALDLWPVLLALNGNLPKSHIAHAAHLLGILFGWLYVRNHWHLSSLVDVSFFKSLPRRWRRSQAIKSLRVFAPEPEPESEGNLEGELDRILAKIHEQGSSSLTEREQSVLTQASQQYKNRK